MFSSTYRLYNNHVPFSFATDLILFFVFGIWKSLQLQEAIKRGPYLARKHTEAQPVVMTADRFWFGFNRGSHSCFRLASGVWNCRYYRQRSWILIRPTYYLNFFYQGNLYRCVCNISCEWIFASHEKDDIFWLNGGSWEIRFECFLWKLILTLI